MDRLVEGEEWDYFIDSLWKYQWTAKPALLTESINKTMYQLSQGIVDIAVKLYMLAQWEAMEADESKDERITAGLLKSVAKRHMQLVQPMLKILRRNDPDLLSLVDDLYPEWNVLDQYLKKSSEKVNLQGEIRSKLNREDKVEYDQKKYIELVKTAIDFGGSSETAEEIARRILHSHEAERDLIDLRKQVVEMVSSRAAAEIGNESENMEECKNETRPKSTKRKQPLNLDEDDLRNALQNADGVDGIYDNLVEMGSIPSSDDISKLIV